ncbi:coagulation factor IXa [Cololabis saira]|uniref:coagulation factor IXa n=1 Tax=Cololabis saira TaxID=129043 RepID=UPI002AD32E84|nr:coagulation factor IXa [Cololabis saira]
MSEKFRIGLTFLLFLLVDFQPACGAPAPASGPVFISDLAANGVLRRHKRYNTGIFEELWEGDLERECLEEKCDLEEAREYFENDEKTMEFWAGYIDGNQCKSNPCLNQGSCNDHTGFYTCNCSSAFTGRNCEIAIAKRCDVNNGDCMHFCDSVGFFGAICSCARGYSLMHDGSSCEADVEFPCGRTAAATISTFRRFLSSSENASSLNNITSTTTPPTTPAGTTEPFHTTSVPIKTRSRKRLPLWALSDYEDPPEHPPRPIQRIIGGDEAKPGEIPWQVALISHPSGHLFCGGSILSEYWIITAAHCLSEGKGSILVRVGEHNTFFKEDSEQDYEILQQYIHPRYNASRSLYNHDIALLRLREPITFSATVRPICIGPMAFSEVLVKRSSPATVSGWGRLRFLGATSTTLQKVLVPYTDRTECKHSSSERITPFMFCAGYYDEEKDACQGDSGGPHTNSMDDTWFLTGIVSWGEECAKEGKYGVYTRVSLYYNWINHVMGVKRTLSIDVDEPDQ